MRLTAGPLSSGFGGPNSGYSLHVFRHAVPVKKFVEKAAPLVQTAFEILPDPLRIPTNFSLDLVNDLVQRRRAFAEEVAKNG